MAKHAFVTERDTLENRKLIQAGLNYLLTLFRGLDESSDGQVLASDGDGSVDWNSSGNIATTQDTFTCTVTTGSGTVTLSNAGNLLTYTKTGRQVAVQGALVVDSVSSPTGTVTINGFPFTSLTGTEFEGALIFPVRMILETGTLTSTNGWIDGAMAAGTDTISLLDGFVADLGAHIQATTIFYFSFTYFTD